MQQVGYRRFVPDVLGSPPRPPRPPGPRDGRSSRWTEHRRARLEELVIAGVEAVRLVGPDFAVEDVARAAGVSKTVLYRYFGDKDELVDALLEQVATAVLLPRLLGELATPRADDRERLRAVVAAFVRFVEDEPALYRFAYAHAGRSGRPDAVAGTGLAVAEALAGLMRDRLAAAGWPPDGASTWAHGVVGMVQLAAQWWSGARTVPAAELVDQLTALAWGGLSTVLPYGGTA